jgi:hypothetical protein
VRFWILGATLLFTFQASASKIIGNGGRVLVCAKREPHVQLLDIYEAELIDLKMGELVGETYQEKFASLLVRLGHRFPNFVVELAAGFQDFEAHKKIRGGVVLSRIDDSFHAVLPNSQCTVPQAAFQRQPMFPRQEWFTINGDLWDELDEFNKTGLVLHEILYRMGLQFGVEHSMGVRYLVGLLLSTDVMTISDEEWSTAFLNSRIKWFETGGLRFPLFEGAHPPCTPVPGEVACTSVNTIKMAEMMFDGTGRMREVTYVEDPQVVTGGSDFVRVTMTTKRLAFSWIEAAGRTMVQVEFEGHGHISGRNGPDFSSATYAYLEGKLLVGFGFFCGKINHESIKCGTLTNLVPIQWQSGR